MKKDYKSVRRERLRIGAALADQLPKRKNLDEVAAATGLSTTAVRNIECLALWKIAHHIRQFSAANSEGVKHGF